MLPITDLVNKSLNAFAKNNLNSSQQIYFPKPIISSNSIDYDNKCYPRTSISDRDQNHRLYAN